MVEPNQLSGFSILADMPLEIIAEIARNAEIKTFKTGAVLFEEGDMATELYGLLEGEVELSLLFRDRVLKAEVRHEEYVHKRVEIIEQEMVFETVAPGEIFAWSALIAPHQLTSTAMCTEPTRLMVLPADALEAVFERTPRAGAVFMKRLAEVIAQRLRHRTDKLIESWYQAFGEERL
jgi:CRP-like cAMP-binding protein